MIHPEPAADDYAEYKKFLEPFGAMLVAPQLWIVHDFPRKGPHALHRSANTMSGAAATIVAAARTAGVATNDPEAMVAFALGFKAARTAAPASPPPLEKGV